MTKRTPNPGKRKSSSTRSPKGSRDLLALIHEGLLWEDFSAALTLARELFDKNNDSAAQATLGWALIAKNGGEADLEKGFDLLREADSRNEPLASFLFGHLYERGYGVSEDLKQALFHYRRGVKLGCTLSLCRMGLAYGHGDLGLKVDMQIARRFLLVAANAGDAEGWFHLGTLYQFSKDHQDFEQAAMYYNKALHAGKDMALVNLAAMFMRGQLGVFPDVQKAVDLLQRAADWGNALAHHNLGMLYAYGPNTYLAFGLPFKTNLKKSFKHMKIASEMNFRVSMPYLGLKYLEGEGAPKDPQEALRWFTRADELGDPQGSFQLGKLYELGEVVPKDLKIAVRHYERAIEKDEPQAMFRLGLMLMRGEGVKKDEKRAVSLIQKAHELGDVEASLEYGKILKEGRLAKRDYEKSFECFQNASNGNIKEACYHLGLAYLHGYGTPVDNAQALHQFKTSGHLGKNPEAVYEAGCLVLRGADGVEKDPLLGVRMIVKAADMGCERATEMLPSLEPHLKAIRTLERRKEAQARKRRERKLAKQAKENAQNGGLMTDAKICADDEDDEGDGGHQLWLDFVEPQ